MESPQEIIENWKKFVEKTKEVNLLEVIKLDLEAEKDNFEDVIREYENLIEEVEEKLSKAKEEA